MRRPSKYLQVGTRKPYGNQLINSSSLFVAMCLSSMDRITFWCFDRDILFKFESLSICNSTTLSGDTTVSYPVIDMELFVTGPLPSYSAMYAKCYVVTLCINGVLMLLLLLAGDVETNPGPTGKYVCYEGLPQKEIPTGCLMINYR